MLSKYVFIIHTPFSYRSCPQIFPTLAFDLRLEGFDSPSNFTDADKEQICSNALTLAGLEDGTWIIWFVKLYWSDLGSNSLCIYINSSLIFCR